MAREWRKRFSLGLPAAYGMVALFAWADFIHRPPDGLANLGLVLLVLPYTLLDQVLGSWLNVSGSVLMPRGHGYIGDHARFFGCGVLLTASLLFSAGLLIDRARHD